MPPKPSAPETIYGLVFPSDAVSFDVEKFDEFIRSQGVEMVHYRAMPCPVGLTDPDDIRMTHEHHQDCSNGHVYTRAGAITTGFIGNGSDNRYVDAGRMDGSTVNIVIPRFYDDKPSERVDVANLDRMYLRDEEITVTTFYRFAAHISGVDRLIFPVVHVVDLMDSHGKRYREGLHFDVRGGQIHWREGEGPGVDPTTGKGTICAIRFTYRPFWYVKNLPHEVRICQSEDELGERKVQRMPQQAVLQREYQFQKEQNDEHVSPEKRQKPGPPSGTFGPR
jgi:hypothetical protein